MHEYRQRERAPQITLMQWLGRELQRVPMSLRKKRPKKPMDTCTKKIRSPFLLTWFSENWLKIVLIIQWSYDDHPMIMQWSSNILIAIPENSMHWTRQCLGLLRVRPQLEPRVAGMAGKEIGAERKSPSGLVWCLDPSKWIKIIIFIEKTWENMMIFQGGIETHQVPMGGDTPRIFSDQIWEVIFWLSICAESKWRHMVGFFGRWWFGLWDLPSGYD